MRKLWLDMESTGVSDADKIWQICGIFEHGGLIEKEFDIRMNPFEKGVVASPIALQMAERNGVTEADLRGYPSQKEGYLAFLGLCNLFMDKYAKHDKAMIYGYNVGFDERFLRALFLEHGNKFFGSYFVWPSISVDQIIADKLGYKRLEFPDFKLRTLCETIIPNECKNVSWHDAMQDIQLTRKLYYAVTEKEKEKALSENLSGKDGR